jgi:hypothetical protein
MSDPFLDRIRETTVDEQLLDLSALKEAAGAASTSLSGERALALVYAAHYRPLSDAHELDLRGRMNSAGEVLPGERDGQLFNVLATEALIIAFSRFRGGVGLVPALAVRCGSHAGWRPVHPDLRVAAASYLQQRSSYLRARISLDSRLVKDRPKSDPGTPERAEEEHEALRASVQHDRERLWERDQLMWWLLSARRSATPFAIAAELESCLRFLPEPHATAELVTTKLTRSPSETLPMPHFPEVDNALAELCPDLFASPAAENSPTGPDPKDERRLVLCLLDQIMLARAYREVNE